MARSLRSNGHIALMEALVRLRKEKSVTQEGLGKQLNRPQSYIAKIETGERRLDAIELMEIAIALNIDVMDLLRPVGIALSNNTVQR